MTSIAKFIKKINTTITPTSRHNPARRSISFSYPPLSKGHIAHQHYKPEEKKNTTTKPKKTFSCRYMNCQQTFTKYFNMRRHVLLCHTTIRPFKCPFCQTEFALLQYYRDHLLQHRPTEYVDHHLQQNRLTDKQSYPLFFVESVDQDGNLLDDYIRAKIEPEFVHVGYLPSPCRE
mmetsp:Transcript_62381/g.71534  ORF Transcript_62381/g.71534 Transcript_62381/m.71534 type:complete len:175 (+) Transcript_62381:204-728(+)